VPVSRLPLVAGVLAGLLLAACAGGEDTGGGALVGAVAPSLAADGAVWVRPAGGRDGPALAGQVVFLEFGFLR
jgi:hypothetical protein